MKGKVQHVHRIAADRIVVNPGGVDLRRFVPFEKRLHLKRRLGFPAGKIHLLTVRNLEPRMGLENLIRALGILRHKGMGIHLILGGEGIERRNIERAIACHGVKDDVTMTGFIPSALLAQYYGASDFFVLPTRRLEGFGLVTAEALACGTPVLGTPVGGTKEILCGLEPHFLFKDVNPEAMAEGIELAVRRFFAQEKEYAALRKRCRIYAEAHYAWKRHTDHLKSMLYEPIGQ
jgi:glycosyltransferase involved in cell wall biosynthesis